MGITVCLEHLQEQICGFCKGSPLLHFMGVLSEMAIHLAAHIGILVAHYLPSWLNDASTPPPCIKKHSSSSSELLWHTLAVIPNCAP